MTAFVIIALVGMVLAALWPVGKPEDVDWTSWAMRSFRRRTKW